MRTSVSPTLCYRACCCLVALIATVTTYANASPRWSAKLDDEIRFYQTTEMGALLVGTKKSLYAVDAERGDVLWRRRDMRLDQTDIAPVVGTDLFLVSYEKSGRTRVEAVDIMTGKAIWQRDKIKGSIMHLAVEPDSELVALVIVRDPTGGLRDGFKRRPSIHMLNLADGDELWKRELDNEIEMAPTDWNKGENGDTTYTLDNYRPPLVLDGRLYLFYDGVTSLEARTGKDRIRERFRVNEDGLALTEADPVWDQQHLYTSGRGRVRAISRDTGRVVWEGKDLGLTPELILTPGVLFVRTGGLFTRLKEGEVVSRGPFGLSAIDAMSGKTLWRYSGADKGLTNVALADQSTLVIADRDELIAIDAQTGKARARNKHRIERAAFVLINEQGQIVVGGRNELAAFASARLGEAAWRARHEPPGRGVLRTIIAIAARTASLYFRYAGVATSAFRGARLVAGARALRWSGLATRGVSMNLTDLAAGAARDYVSGPLKLYGAAARVDRARRSLQSSGLPGPKLNVDIEESLLDRLDPAMQLERLSRFLWRRQRLAVLRGEFMYFYTELETGGRGVAGVNLNSGRTERMIRLDEPDYRLTADEVAGELFVAKENRLLAYPLSGR